MNNISASFFSLVKSNFGAFKSDKQAAFLLSQCRDGIYSAYETLHFGEYDARTKRNTASIAFDFYVNADGVYKIVKTTSKGPVIHWEKTEEFKNKMEQQKQARDQAISDDNKRQQEYKAKMIKEIQTEIEAYAKELEQYKNNTAAKEMIGNNELWSRIVKTAEDQLEQKVKELEKYQD